MRFSVVSAVSTVSLVLLVLAALASAADVSRSSASSRARLQAYLNSRASVRAGFGSWDAVMKHFTADLDKWETEEAKVALKLLQDLHAASTDDFSTVEKFGLKAKALNKDTDLGTTNRGDVFAWLKALRAFADPPPEQVAQPKMWIQGAGPAGLSTALYARAKARVGGLGVPKIAGSPLATVTIKQDRPKFSRQHMVDTVDGKTVEGVAMNGMSLLLEDLGTTHLDKWFKYARHDKGSSTIVTATLEKLLAVSAVVLGVKIEVTSARETVGKSKAEVLAALDKSLFDKDLSLNGATRCAAPRQKRPTAFAPKDDFDVFIGADGAGSSFRSWDPLLKDKNGQSPTFAPIPLGQGGTNEESLVKIRRYALPVIAFVMRGGGRVKCSDYVLRKESSTVIGPGGKFASDAFYTKPQAGLLDMGENSMCMFEVPFQAVPGNILLSAFKSDCSWNFNVFSDTKISDTDEAGELNRLALAFRIFNAVWKTKNDDNLVKHFNSNLAAFKSRVVEIKVYSVGFRYSYRPQKTYSDVPPVELAKYHPAANGKTEKLALLVGDAAREAFPDGGMGANDAHHMAIQAANIARQFKDEGYQGGNMKTDISAMQTHAIEVVKALVAKAVNEHLYEDTGKQNGNIIGKRPSTVTDTFQTNPITIQGTTITSAKN